TGKVGQRRRPASQETCRDAMNEPRAGCPGGAHASCGNGVASPACVPRAPRPQHHGDTMQATTALHNEATDKVAILLHDSGYALTEPGYRFIRRNGQVTPFDPVKITVALMKAFLAVEGSTA